MSFVSVLKAIGHGIGVVVADAVPLEPAIGSIPVVGAPADLVINAIAAVEKLIPGSGNGAAKKAAVTSIVSATNPTVDAATLSTTIDDVVAAFNAISTAVAKLKPSAAASAQPAS